MFIIFDAVELKFQAAISTEVSGLTGKSVQ